MTASRLVMLKWMQGLLSVVTLVLGLATFIPLGYVTRYFGSNCVLFSDLVVLVSVNHTVEVDLLHSQWGRDVTCYFTTFLSVVAAIHAFIWCWFFFHMYRLLREDGNELYLALPAVLLHGILFLCAFVSSIILSHGVATFCSNLTSNVNHRFSCHELQFFTWRLFGKTVYFSLYLQIAQGGSWLMTLAILAQCVVTVSKSYLELFPADKEELLGQDGYEQHGVDRDTGSVVFLSSARSPDSGGAERSSGITGSSANLKDASLADSSTISSGDTSTRALVI